MFCFALVVLLAWISIPPFSPAMLESSLTGKVAIVTGASRGIGKGIAVGLGEMGATVYVTGRTKSRSISETDAVKKPMSGSLEDTCDVVAKAGGRCIPLGVDSSNDTQLEALFDHVVQAEGKLDILVNNAFSAVSHMPKTAGQPFWEKGPDMWDIVNHVGLRSHYIASVFAARVMSKRKQGLIVNVGSFGGVNYIFDVAYGIGKAAMDRMANDMAIELETENITMVSLWPGLVKTENVKDGAIDTNSMKERRGMQPGMPQIDFNDLLSTPLAETPLFNGRAVAAFARDQQRSHHSGKVLIPAVMAFGYGIVDEHGLRSPPLTSLKHMLSPFLKHILEYCGLWHVRGECFTPLSGEASLSRNAVLFWNKLPDFAVPGFLLRLGAGSPNL